MRKKAVWMKYDPLMQAWISLIPTPRCMIHGAYHAHLITSGAAQSIAGLLTRQQMGSLALEDTQQALKSVYDQIAQELSSGNGTQQLPMVVVRLIAPQEDILRLLTSISQQSQNGDSNAGGQLSIEQSRAFSSQKALIDSLMPTVATVDQKKKVGQPVDLQYIEKS
ncbi:hypothetical protein MP228_004064 [Amoeboaphelidium protococcarum]|nr:hypothetical protein MP228_004064 [Amoeboaphelidium protococcarum]